MSTTDQENLSKALEIMDLGGVILYKTDTIWGLGCDARNEEAIRKVYQIKKRALDKPFVCLVSSMEMLQSYVGPLHPRIETLLSLHKRPLTVVYPGPVDLPQILHGKDQSIAIRITHNRSNQLLINTLGAPLVSTSANFSGKAFPSSFEDISLKLKEKVDYVLECTQMHADSVPSTMVKFTPKGELIFIRD